MVGWLREHIYTLWRNIKLSCHFVRVSKVYSWVVMRKYILKHKWLTNTFICLKNNTTQLPGRSKLCWNFFSTPGEASDIYRFPALHLAENHFLLENLWISDLLLGNIKERCFSLLQSVSVNNLKRLIQVLIWSFTEKFTVKEI